MKMPLPEDSDYSLANHSFKIAGTCSLCNFFKCSRPSLSENYNMLMISSDFILLRLGYLFRMMSIEIMSGTRMLS